MQSLSNLRDLIELASVTEVYRLVTARNIQVRNEMFRALQRGSQGECFILKRLLKAVMPSLLGCQGICALILNPSEW